MSGVHFMSMRLDWQTPDAVYDDLDREFHFDFDPCPHNPSFDGLTAEWGKSNFVNPPYGREIPKWIAKGYAEWKKGKRVVFLIPSRTDTRWWHDYIMQATEIRFIKGRLKFKGATNSAPFPSCVVVFDALLTAEEEYKMNEENKDYIREKLEEAMCALDNVPTGCGGNDKMEEEIQNVYSILDDLRSELLN